MGTHIFCRLGRASFKLHESVDDPKMRRAAVSFLRRGERSLSGLTIGSGADVVHFTNEDLKGRGRKRPKTYVKKRPREPVSQFRETVDSSGEVETRRIRTKPRRRDYSKIVAQLRKCVTWEHSMVTLGKYVEPPRYDPHRPDLEDGDIDLECLPDRLDFYNPFTKEIDKIDFSILPTGEGDTSREAKALRWTEKNIPLRDDHLPIALRNPEIREKTLREALGPDSKPKDIWKIWNMREPTVKEIDPWIVEEYKKLPVNKQGKRTNVIQLVSHPRTLRAAVEYLKIMNPSDVEGHISDSYLQELSEQLLSGKWKPPKEVPDPPNPYRMEDYERVNVVLPKEDPDDVLG